MSTSRIREVGLSLPYELQVRCNELYPHRRLIRRSWPGVLRSPWHPVSLARGTTEKQLRPLTIATREALHACLPHQMCSTNIAVAFSIFRLWRFQVLEMRRNLRATPKRKESGKAASTHPEACDVCERATAWGWLCAGTNVQSVIFPLLYRSAIGATGEATRQQV